MKKRYLVGLVVLIFKSLIAYSSVSEEVGSAATKSFNKPKTTDTFPSFFSPHSIFNKIEKILQEKEKNKAYVKLFDDLITHYPEENWTKVLGMDIQKMNNSKKIAHLEKVQDYIRMKYWAPVKEFDLLVKQFSEVNWSKILGMDILKMNSIQKVAQLKKVQDYVKIERWQATQFDDLTSTLPNVAWVKFTGKSLDKMKPGHKAQLFPILQDKVPGLIPLAEFDQLVKDYPQGNWDQVQFFTHGNKPRSISQLTSQDKVKNIKIVKDRVRSMIEAEDNKLAMQFDNLTQQHSSIDWNHILESDITKLNNAEKAQLITVVNTTIEEVEQKKRELLRQHSLTSRVTRFWQNAVNNLLPLISVR